MGQTRLMGLYEEGFSRLGHLCGQVLLTRGDFEDRVSYLNNLYHADPFGTSIVLVLHGDEIPFFAISNFDKYKDLVTRAQSLTVGGTIDIRMCEVAARGHGLTPANIHGFVKLVPMADAELVRLQQEEGYVYMQ